MENRQNFERIKLQSNWAGEPTPVADYTRGAADAGLPSPALSVLLQDVLLPILERVNDSLDELEAAVNRIADAPNASCGHCHGRGDPTHQVTMAGTCRYCDPGPS